MSVFHFKTSELPVSSMRIPPIVFGTDAILAVLWNALLQGGVIRDPILRYGTGEIAGVTGYNTELFVARRNLGASFVKREEGKETRGNDFIPSFGFFAVVYG